MYVLVAGGGKIGYYLARSLLNDGHEVLIIERDRRRADSIAEDLGSVVLRGDACEASTLAEAGASRADVVVAATGDDEDNLVICQLAQRKFNAGRTVARINNPKNRRIFNLLGLDVAVSATELILTQIQQQLPGHSLVHLIKLRAQDLELIEATLGPRSPLVGRTPANLGLPQDSAPAADPARRRRGRADAADPAAGRRRGRRAGADAVGGRAARSAGRLRPIRSGRDRLGLPLGDELLPLLKRVRYWCEHVVGRHLRLERLRASCMRDSSSVLPPLRWLQARQALTRFSQVCAPPRWRGITWSSVRSRACAPQYWQVYSSRTKTSLRQRRAFGRGRLIR